MAKFEMDTEFIAKLAKLLEETNLGEIELADGDRRIRVARPAVNVTAAPMAMAAPMVAAAPVAAPATAAATAGGGDAAAHPGAVKSPMVGTAYLAPEPGGKPYVEVGDVVREGQTLFIIEAMKTMNQIPSPRSGKIARIMVEDGQPVEYGEPMMIIE